MEVGFFFWPFKVDLIERLADRADRYGYDMIGIADTPGNAMDPWVSATIVARATTKSRVAICVTNLVTRDASVSAAAIASIENIAKGRAVLGIGAGHSGTRNLGRGNSTAKELGEGVATIKTLLQGKPVAVNEATVHLPWVKSPSKVFLAASHPLGLAAAGRTADGVFLNYGLGKEDVAQSEAIVRRGITEAGRSENDVEILQIAALDCAENVNVARDKVGAILAFVAGYVIGDKKLETRGVPEQFREPLLELRRRYSTRPGDADIALVRELGLFDYLAGRLAICGTPEECLTQTLAAKAAGVKRLMLTISLASDPVRTVELFGEYVLPKLRL
jgi:5,10-methylenetetrahydromethanopterin reductase